MNLYGDINYQILNIRSDGNYMKVKFDNLVKGMGQTLGNALKRTLLSEVEGTAVRAFSLQDRAGIGLKLTGIVEDTTEIAQALSQLKIKRLPVAEDNSGLDISQEDRNRLGLHPVQEDSKIKYYNTRPFILEGCTNGKAQLTAGDLYLIVNDNEEEKDKQNFEILNKDLVIFNMGTSDKDGKFLDATIRILVTDGVYYTPDTTKLNGNIKEGLDEFLTVPGYKPTDRYIEVMSTYQPVERVNYTVHNNTLDDEIDTLLKELSTKPDSLDLRDTENPITISVTKHFLEKRLREIFRKTSLFQETPRVMTADFEVDSNSKYTESLILEIETSGTVTPHYALFYALECLRLHFTKLSSTIKDCEPVVDAIDNTVYSMTEKELLGNKVKVALDEIPNFSTEEFNHIKSLPNISTAYKNSANPFANTEIVSILMTKEEAKQAVLGKLDNERILTLLDEAKVNIYENSVENNILEE